MNNLDNKKILITGGTGSFGTALVKRLIKDYNVNEIRIFSRDETKQYFMKHELNNDKITYEIGDIRDKERILEAMKDIDIVFHAAAFKHVPSCEEFTMEAVKTNILGADNVINAAIKNNVSKVVGLSTDKAVYPICTMGLSKSIMEKIFLEKAKEKSNTQICITRFGNVLMTRGSVIPRWISQAKLNKPIYVTSANMTRFLLPMQEALDLVLYAFTNGKNGEIYTKRCYSCNIYDLAEAIIDDTNSKSEIIISGIRNGEKLHESLVTDEELMHAESKDNYIIVYPGKSCIKISKEGIVSNDEGICLDYSDLLRFLDCQKDYKEEIKK